MKVNAFAPAWRHRSIPLARAAASLLRRCRSRLSQWWTAAMRETYYRFGFGRRLKLASGWEEKISRIEQALGAGDIPQARDVWERQYGGGRWSYLANEEEAQRYSAIAGYIDSLKPAAALLDVGCGEALLLASLRSSYRRYIGIDLAEAAIERGRKRQGELCFLTQADAQTFTADQTFDVIVFNEVLYYFPNPMAVVERYERWLNPGGLFIASLYEHSVRARGVRREISRRYRLETSRRVGAGAHSWSVLVFAPKPSRTCSTANHSD
jgi:2-polyprenyl-3-methyl-5-hydroxy-6-metoxy-1,4-benzoquinol methylase